MPTLRQQGTLAAVLSTITDREWRSDLLVFVSYLATAKLAQYILYSLHTSPALLWAPTGIALAAVLLKGNKMWVPIALAHLVAILTVPVYLPVVSKLIAVIGFTVQPLIGAWLFKKWESNGTIHRSRDVMVFLGGAFVVSSIGPLFLTMGQVLLHTLAETVLLTFSRAWAGGILSIVVVTPFITGWYYSPSNPFKRQQYAEAASAFGLLTLAIYVLFWVSYPALVFLLIFFLCVVLFWISFRFGSRVNTSAILYLTVFGILGSIIAHPTPTPLHSQLFADELFILLIAPIFLQFFVLAEERRQGEHRLSSKVVQLEKMTQQLAANDNAKNEFIAILAHELRNPLSAVVTTLEVLKLDIAKGESAELVASAEQQTHGMRRLLDDLLDVARINERKFAVLPERTSLKEIIDLSVNATEQLRTSRKQTIRVWMPVEPIRLFVDPIRMEQVLSNLLNNSSKYSPVGSEVEILASVDGTNLLIVVKDNGDGIPPERLEEIFAPFQQLAPSPSRAAGIGIGLFLTRQIVQMHGGTITAHSQGAGSGSTFTILLPIVPIPEGAPELSPIIQQPVSSHSKRILLVDDNEAAAVGMERLLAHYGHQIHMVHDGKDALTAFHDFLPEVVLLDIGLPDMSGHEVARKIRSHGGKQPILIALTGYGQESDKSEASVSGFNHHLTKPVGIAEVVGILNQL